MKLKVSILNILLLYFAIVSVASAEELPKRAQTRAELLYTTHCSACHSEQIHWRDNKIVTDEGSLYLQVQRWQNTLKLAWSIEDIEGVTEYLNQLYYHYKVHDLAVHEK